MKKKGKKKELWIGAESVINGSVKVRRRRRIRRRRRRRRKAIITTAVAAAAATAIRSPIGDEWFTWS
uniref:Uncharacterized protein n=1 Tax=Helianthus annuus TaxID=4232 RepID=A0A251TD11_HELAN